MAQPYVGEIRMFAGNFAPAGWAHCDGQLLPIWENEALFQLIGTTYGGDGQETFAVPDLRGRVPIHAGNGPDGVTYVIGEQAGVEEVTLTPQQIPVHTHPLFADTQPATTARPEGKALAETELDLYAAPDWPQASMSSASIGPAGGNQPHTNLQPSLCVTFIISLFGIFPSPT